MKPSHCRGRVYKCSCVLSVRDNVQNPFEDAEYCPRQRRCSGQCVGTGRLGRWQNLGHCCCRCRELRFETSGVVTPDRPPCGGVTHYTPCVMAFVLRACNALIYSTYASIYPCPQHERCFGTSELRHIPIAGFRGVIITLGFFRYALSHCVGGTQGSQLSL